MEQENFYSLGNENFALTGYQCKFGLQTGDDGISSLTVGIDASEQLHYAFNSENGLCLTTPFGSVRTPDLLGKVASLPDNDAKKTLTFFEKNGFLFPLPHGKDVILDLKSFVDILYRIKATMLLQSLLGEIDPDYEKILHLTLYLLLSDRVTLSIGDKTSYTTCNYRIHDLLNDPILTRVNSDDSEEAAQKNSYTVTDSIYPPLFELNADEYGDIVSAEPFTYNYPGIKDNRYRKLTSLYNNSHTESRNNRLIIEFLFHYMNTVGVIKKIDYINGIKYYGEPTIDNFDDKLKKALLNVARIILSLEINYNVGKMRPYYSPVQLEGTWKAPSLLTALYFSIFYRNPGVNIYRKCANPSCHNYFLVSVTNERKRYCCGECRNANNQRTHRLKIKKSR